MAFAWQAEEARDQRDRAVAAKESEAEELDKGSLANQPLVEAGVRNTIGQTFLGLARYDDAAPNLRKSLDMLRAALPAGHPHIAVDTGRLAHLYWSQGKLDQSVPMFEEALGMQEASLGRQHLDTQRTVANLGVNYKDAGRLAEAIPLLEEAFARSKQNPQLAWVGVRLLDAYNKTAATASPAEAAELHRNFLAVRAQLVEPAGEGERDDPAALVARAWHSMRSAKR